MMSKFYNCQICQILPDLCVFKLRTSQVPFCSEKHHDPCMLRHSFFGTPKGLRQSPQGAPEARRTPLFLHASGSKNHHCGIRQGKICRFPQPLPV